MSWSDENIRRIAELFADETGFQLPENRRNGIEAAIRRTMKRFEFTDTAVYEAALIGGRSDLVDALVSELTIQESYFYRHSDQIDYIHEVIMPTRVTETDHTFRCWSAGCANGQESYTLAILAQTFIPTVHTTVVGTDVSIAATQFAQKGEYRAWSLRATDQQHWIRRHIKQSGQTFLVSDEIKGMVRFFRHNLVLDSIPDPGGRLHTFDLIVCRNVLMYFSLEVAFGVITRLCNALSDGGFLVLGPSDPFPPESDTLSRVLDAPSGTFVYRQSATSSDRPRKGALDPTSSPVTAVPPLSASVAPAVRLQVAPGQPGVAPSIPEENEAETVDGSQIFDDATAGLVNRGRPEDALQYLDDQLSMGTPTVRVLYSRSLVLLSMSRFPEAVKSLRQVLFLDAGLVAAHFTNGIAFLHQGATREARRAFEQAHKLASQLPADEILPFADGESAGRMARAAAAQIAVLDTTSYVAIKPRTTRGKR